MNDGRTRRQVELDSVAPEHHTSWLAGQIDEVEDGLVAALNANTQVVKENTESQHETSRRIVLAVLGALLAAAMTLITTILIAGLTGG